MGALSNILPLIILLVVLGVVAAVGYICYTVAHDIKSHTKKKMEKKNVVFSKEGMKVGVKEVDPETYADRTQSVLVKAWNYSSIPNYKSRLWNQEAEINKKDSRVPYSRASSSYTSVHHESTLKRTISTPDSIKRTNSHD